MFVRTYAGAIVGIDAAAVTVEVNIAGGGLGMYLVGLPDSAIRRLRTFREIGIRTWDPQVQPYKNGYAHEPRNSGCIKARNE